MADANDERLDRMAAELKFFQGAVPASAAHLLSSISELVDAGSEPVPRFRRYELHERLGEGGMAVVYRASDRDLNRAVAVKVLREALSGTGVLQERFRREMQIGAKFAHPNIVTLLDAGEEGGRAFIVMELVRGHPLSRVLEGRRTEMRTAIGLLEKSARAVQHAHERGVIHRDLKPGNILITEAGEPKVADFGLALLLDSSSDLTRSGAALGTPSYMAPEQVGGGGRGATVRTDVYALGAILYEILTGRPPHTGESVMEVLRLVQAEEPLAPRRINRRIPADLETICLKALEKEPARRYASAADFADDLARHFRGESIAAKPAGAVSRSIKWSRRHRAVSAAVMVGLAGLLAVVAAVGETTRRARVARSLEVARLLEDGRRADGERRGLEQELARLKDRHREVTASIDPATPAGLRRPMWDLEEKIEALSVRIADLTASALAAYTRAAGLDAACEEAHRYLTGHYWAEFERAEYEGDPTVAAEARQYVLLHDLDGRFRRRFAAAGTLSVVTDPPGAEIFLFRYDTDPDRTLVARPFDPRRGEVSTSDKRESSEFNRAGRSPLAAMSLVPGSYLALLRLEGYRDVRYPVLIEREALHAARVTLYREEEIGSDFVYVPAGRFIRGGDPQSPSSLPRDPDAFTGDYFIGRREVRMNEYIDFLNHLIETEGVEAARSRSPRAAVGGATMLKLPAEGPIPRYTGPSAACPALGISWEDVAAFCAWKTAQSGASRIYRLPTTLEWEKAARGVDGRYFPWGRHFDWSHVRAYDVSVPNRDESPYGVFDLAGGLREWCFDWFDETRGFKHGRGGGWTSADPSACRAATQQMFAVREPYGALGFRLVVLPDRTR